MGLPRRRLIRTREIEKWMTRWCYINQLESVARMAGDSEDLSARLKRISELTDRLMAMQEDTADARELAVHIHREIAAARDQVKQLGQMKTRLSNAAHHTRRRPR
jgi:hypothetical protein